MGDYYASIISQLFTTYLQPDGHENIAYPLLWFIRLDTRVHKCHKLIEYGLKASSCQGSRGNAEYILDWPSEVHSCG